MRLLFALLPLGITACNTPMEADPSELGTQAQVLTFWPPEAGRGTTLDAKITSTNSIFEFVDNSLDLGGGVTVNSLTVLDGWSAVANITVDPAATLGGRDGYLDTRGGAFTMSDALTIVDDSFVLAPPGRRSANTCGSSSSAPTPSGPPGRRGPASARMSRSPRSTC